jgi:hypothetical protein
VESRPGKIYRGSPNHERPIRARGKWSWEMWLLVAWVLFVLFVAMPWMMSR